MPHYSHGGGGGLRCGVCGSKRVVRMAHLMPHHVHPHILLWFANGVRATWNVTTKSWWRSNGWTQNSDQSTDGLVRPLLTPQGRLHDPKATQSSRSWRLGSHLSGHKPKTASDLILSFPVAAVLLFLPSHLSSISAAGQSVLLDALVLSWLVTCRRWRDWFGWYRDSWFAFQGFLTSGMADTFRGRVTITLGRTGQVLLLFHFEWAISSSAGLRATISAVDSWMPFSLLSGYCRLLHQ